MPIDIEIGRISGLGPVLQDLHPPGVFAAGSHVIGNDVHNQAHAALFEFLVKRLETGFGAQFRIQMARIDNVVAVTAAMPATQNRRSVDVGHTEVVKIIEQLYSIAESK